MCFDEYSVEKIVIWRLLRPLFSDFLIRICWYERILCELKNFSFPFRQRVNQKTVSKKDEEMQKPNFRFWKVKTKKLHTISRQTTYIYLYTSSYNRCKAAKERKHNAKCILYVLRIFICVLVFFLFFFHL